jgi:hypothetical protein
MLVTGAARITEIGLSQQQMQHKSFGNPRSARESPKESTLWRSGSRQFLELAAGY